MLEANGGGDAIRVSNDALDFYSQFMGWIRIGQDTRVLHDSFDDAVGDKGIGGSRRTVDSQGFLQWDLEVLRTSKN